jgi:hypothetical protein
MQTWSIELSGTITRDIIWREVEAETEQEVREICARELPTYRVRSIIPASLSDTSLKASTQPSPSDENSSNT